jgi:hypothetical protein
MRDVDIVVLLSPLSRVPKGVGEYINKPLGGSMWVRERKSLYTWVIADKVKGSATLKDHSEPRLFSLPRCASLRSPPYHIIFTLSEWLRVALSCDM